METTRLRHFRVCIPAALVLLTASTLCAGEIAFEEGIEYANPDDQHLQLNLAQPKDETGPDRPAVLCIHGGGFRAGKRDSWNGLCKKLAEHGYVAVTVTYRLTPKYPFPAAVEDVKTAVRRLRANSQTADPDRRRPRLSRAGCGQGREGGARFFGYAPVTPGCR